MFSKTLLRKGISVKTHYDFGLHPFRRLLPTTGLLIKNDSSWLHSPQGSEFRFMEVPASRRLVTLALKKLEVREHPINNSPLPHPSSVSKEIEK